MFETFDLPFVQRALWVLIPLAIAGGILGTWIVLRGLAFYSHAVGTAAFPGLVLADGLGFAAPPSSPRRSSSSTRRPARAR